MHQTSYHHMSLPDGPPGVVPEWLHIIPAGTFSGVDGRGPFKLTNAAAVIANSMSAGKLVLDENHSTDLAAPRGEPAPARGWVVELQSRADGIWGRVEWNEDGKHLMATKSYRGISPVFVADKKTGEVIQVQRVSLTNNPNLAQLQTLHHQQETGVDLGKLRKALGLAETADGDAIVAAVERCTAEVTAHAANIAAIAAAAGATATTAQDLVVQLQAQQSAAGDVQLMAGKIVALETQLNTMKADASRAAAVAYVDGAIKEGKNIVNLRDHYIARHMVDAASVEREIGNFVSINAGGLSRTTHAASDDDPTDTEMTVAKKMGLDPKALAAHRRKADGATNKGAA